MSIYDLRFVCRGVMDLLFKEHQAPKIIALTGNHPAPYQVDLAEDPRYAGKLKEMEALLLSEEKRLDDPLLILEPVMPRHHAQVSRWLFASLGLSVTGSAVAD